MTIPGRNRQPLPFDLRLLESFVVLADELHFGRAAGKLGFAQPALSRQIHRLETQLGIRLFERSAHGVALTAAGDAFRPAAEASLSAAHAAAHEATSVQRGLSGQLAIAAALGSLVLIRGLLSDFAMKHPQVKLEFVSMTDAAGSESVIAAAMDAAVLWAGTQPPEAFVETAVPIADIPVGVRVRVSHPLASLDTVPAAALVDQRLIMFPRAAGPEQFDRIVESFGGPQRAGGIEEVALIGSARSEMMRALDDHSFTVGPLALESDAGSRDIVARPVSPASDPARLWLVWNGDASAALALLIRHLH